MQLPTPTILIEPVGIETANTEFVVVVEFEILIEPVGIETFYAQHSK